MKFLLITLLVGTCLTVTWPKVSSIKTVGAPITVKAGSTFDGFAKNNGKWVRYERGRNGLGDCTKVEGGKADAVFLLEKGATLKNVVLGAKSVEHVHCIGDGCTIQNVYWEDVCEDALTFENSSNTNSKFVVKGGAARNGSDKIIQHNSAGTVYIENFYVENSGKLYRACGNCKKGYQGRRTVFMTNVTANKVGLLLDIILTLEILLLLRMSKFQVDMFAEPLLEETMVKNQLQLDIDVKVVISALAFAKNKKFK